VKKEAIEEKCHGNDIDDARGLLGKAINEFTSMGHSGFQRWQQSLLLEHASEDVM